MRQNLKIWHPETCVISDNAEIGNDCVIHPGTIIYDDVKIGNNCHLEANCFLPNGITLEDDVFLAPFVKFANDTKPPSKGKFWKKTLVKRGAVLGINVTVLPGVTIGKYAFIAANSLITKDVPDFEEWRGSPARFYKLRKDLCTEKEQIPS